MSGYVHYNKVSGINAVAVGKRDSEIDIADGSGNLIHAGTTIVATGAEINAAADLSAQDSMVPGVGFKGTGTVLESSVVQHGGIIKTEMIIDLTGTVTSSGDTFILGASGGGVAYIGQITAAKNGTTLMAGQITCLETPATGDPDIDLYSATQGTGATSTLVTSLTETPLLSSGASWSASVTPVIMSALPVANSYLYLTTGTAFGSIATYTAGRFLIELWAV